MNEACAFAGYRPKRITMDYDSDSSAYDTLINELKIHISNLACFGSKIFYTDMSIGVGMWCAEIVLSLQKQFSGLKLIVLIPFYGQCCNLPESYQKQYSHILSYCHEVNYLNKKYTDLSYYDSAFHMVTTADILLAVCNKNNIRGVAGRTALMAKEFNKHVIYINPKRFPPVYEKNKHSDATDWFSEYLI